jgi:ABC-2 type transport system ATP-binding protein
LAKQTLGSTTSVTLFGRLDHDLAERGRADGLELGPVGLQDLFVHLTAAAPTDRKELFA